MAMTKMCLQTIIITSKNLLIGKIMTLRSSFKMITLKLEVGEF